ncbi:unnamed protein product, partial [Ectocarpus sp. 12 AP-2014]
AADFGLSGVLLSALEVGEIFLSCEGGLTDSPFGEARAGNGTKCSGSARRNSLARAGKGGIRPLAFHEFLEALVRISLECFRSRGSGVWDVGQEACCEVVAPGHCLRALLTHMWRRLHDSSELALNGVRAGGTRHRSSIQKGALLKGVQLFNEQMLSRCRAEGFQDFASGSASSTTSTSAGTSLLYSPRQGHAMELLRTLLA